MAANCWILYWTTLFIVFQCSLSKDVENGQLTFIKAMDALNSQRSWLSSPVSIKSVLGELYLGSKGSTKSQLESSLNIKNEEQLSKEQSALFEAPREGVVWKMANKILVKNTFPLLPAFKSKIASVFHSEIENTDFSKPEETAKSINSWVSGKTNGLIKELLSPRDIDTSTRLVILNAVYFKGTWKYSFEKEETMKQCFYTQAKKCSQTDMMKQKNQFKYAVNKELSAKLIQLPYNDARYSMVIVLPDKTDGLTSVVSKLPKYQLTDIINKMTYEHIDLSMPKFTTKYKTNLNDPLKKMGLSSIFEPSADFSAMTSTKGLYVSDVFHEAQISVSEEGTVAAASTGMAMTRSLDSRPPKFTLFTADHPFLYFIIFDNNQVLFAGEYIN